MGILSSASHRVGAAAPSTAAPAPVVAAVVALAAALAATLVLATATATAGADPRRDVEALIGQNLRAAITADRTAFDATVTDDAIIIPLARELGPQLLDPEASDVDCKLGALTLVIDAANRVAWFHAPVDATYRTPGARRRRGAKVKATLRVSGVAVDERGWKLGAVMYSVALPDPELFARATPRIARPAPGGAAIRGDVGIATAVAPWFTATANPPRSGLGDAQGSGAASANPSHGGLGDAQRRGGASVASGAAPDEFATGGAAGKLAAAWDHLEMWHSSIDARVWRRAIAFARVDVGWPRGAAGAVPMVLGAVLVRDDAPAGARESWRWVSLNFATRPAM